MNIRPATIDDLPSLLNLEQGIIDSERPYDLFLKKEDVAYYDIPNLISDSKAHLVAVELDGEIIGSGYAQIRPSKACHVHENHCYLGFIYLEPEHRGKAVGRAILDALKDWGVSQGMEHFHLNVYSENKSAIRAYEKAGFARVSVLMELVV